MEQLPFPCNAQITGEALCSFARRPLARLARGRRVIPKVVQTDVHSIANRRWLVSRILIFSKRRAVDELAMVLWVRGSRDLSRPIDMRIPQRPPNDLLTRGAVGHCLPSVLDDFHLPSFATDALEMFKIAFVHGGDVCAAEDADLELLRRRASRRELGTGGLEIVKRLVDNFVGANVRGNRMSVALMSDELPRRCQINTVDVSVSASGVGQSKVGQPASQPG